VAARVEPLTWAQLQSADTILLNKLDLLARAEAAALERLVQLCAPWAQVVCCEFGKVPLPRIMSLQLTGGAGTDCGAGVSHEAALRQEGMYVTASEAPPRRCEDDVSAAPAASCDARAPAWAAGRQHGAAGYHALDFTSATPFALAGFQDFMAAAGAPLPAAAADDGASAGLRAGLCGLLRGVRRVKGVLWFAECREERWHFHISGRLRGQITHACKWQGRPSVQLVAIGQESFGEASVARLRGALQVCPAEVWPLGHQC